VTGDFLSAIAFDQVAASMDGSNRRIKVIAILVQLDVANRCNCYRLYVSCSTGKSGLT
jgi:hypothetical protein